MCGIIGILCSNEDDYVSLEKGKVSLLWIMCDKELSFSLHFYT